MNYIVVTAKALGISKSTVCRALNTAENVSFDTRKKVNDYIAEHFPEKLTSRDSKLVKNREKQKLLTFIMPNKPNFYWDKALYGVKKAVKKYGADNIYLDFYFYSGNISENELYNIICRKEQLMPDGLAVVPVQSEKIAAKLANLSSKIPVVCFNEYCHGCDEIPIIVSRGFDEGQKIGEMVCDQVNDGTVLVLRFEGYESNVINDRFKGFSEYCQKFGNNLEIIDSGCKIEANYKLEEKYVYNTIFPSLMARTISKYLENRNNIKAVYVPNGTFIQLLMAIRKVGTNELYVFGHEADDRTDDFFKKGYKGGYVNSDIVRQAYDATKYLIKNVNNEPSEDGNKVFTNFSFKKYD